MKRARLLAQLPHLLLAAIVFFVSAPCMAATRHYYIAAEDLTWDYAPSGRDLIHGGVIPRPWTSQTKWPKTRYIEYTDATFSMRKPQPEWLGILGPMIRAEVGDAIVVDFINRSQTAHSIHPHGLRYDKDNEGSMYLPSGHGAVVPPGGRFTYRWYADAGSGPGPGELSSKVWWYHAHTDEAKEANAGLLGPIVVTAKGKAKADGSPRDVDREFVALFMQFDQLKGKDSGLFYSINGYIFGNLPGLVMKQGERVRWYLLGMGSEKDLHSPHWHGKTVSDNLRTTDVIELLPGSMVTVDMLADNPGTWLFHCHVADHMEAGMMATYTIYQPSTRPCPIKLAAGNFWNATEQFSLTLENVSGKTIQSFALESEQFLAPQYLHRPFQGHLWGWEQPLAPGQQQTLSRKAYSPSEQQTILGWVFVPDAVTFSDGSVWKPESDGECFKVFWRDNEHPQPDVLPPLQHELHLD
jgi:FtsP/CotA-like multicopper oxidase with cupredoxin domain